MVLLGFFVVEEEISCDLAKTKAGLKVLRAAGHGVTEKSQLPPLPLPPPPSYHHHGQIAAYRRLGLWPIGA